MSRPTITAIVPTQGRPTLERTLDSVRDQLLPGDEVLVVIDTHEMDRDTQTAIGDRIAPYGPQFWVLGHDAERHNWGHSQINHALTCATGDYIVANDDDDIWTPGAFAAIREAAQTFPGRLLLFRFRSYIGGGFIFWHTPGLEWVRQGHIGGHSLVMPNIPGKVGWRTTTRYEADFDQIVDAIQKHAPDEPVFCDFVIASQRPQEAR